MNLRRYRWGFLLAALALAGIYLLALHPVSGALGGMFFLLSGWAIPSLVVGLIAAWLALFFQSKVARGLVFVVASILLGLNTAIPGLVVQATASRDVEWHVERMVTADPPVSIHALYEKKPGHALVSTLRVMKSYEDYDCNCLYFRANDDVYYEVFLDRELMDLQGRLSKASTERPIFSYDLAPDAGGQTATVTFRISDRQGASATFTQHGLPYHTLPAGNAGRFYPIGHFYFGNALDTLLHNNIWLTVIGGWVPNYFDADGFRAFRAQALRVSSD
jgi:hypothetical protein